MHRTISESDRSEDQVDAERFTQRLDILLADMESFVDQLQWATEQMLHQAPAMHSKKCMMVFAEEKLDSSTFQSLEGQRRRSIGSWQPYISSRTLGQVSFSCAASSICSAGELSQTDSDLDPMADSKYEDVSMRQQMAKASHLAYGNQCIDRSRSPSLAIEVFKVASIQDMPRSPSSRSLSNVWGTVPRDAVPRKQSEGANLELAMHEKLTKLLGRKKLKASRFFTTEQ